eukprot:1023367-Lingulodinium_polyedra.AAC.1
MASQPGTPACRSRLVRGDNPLCSSWPSLVLAPAAWERKSEAPSCSSLALPALPRGSCRSMNSAWWSKAFAVASRLCMTALSRCLFAGTFAKPRSAASVSSPGSPCRDGDAGGGGGGGALDGRTGPRRVGDADSGEGERLRRRPRWSEDGEHLLRGAERRLSRTPAA